MQAKPQQNASPTASVQSLPMLTDDDSGSETRSTRTSSPVLSRSPSDSHDWFKSASNSHSSSPIKLFDMHHLKQSLHALPASPCSPLGPREPECSRSEQTRHGTGTDELETVKLRAPSRRLAYGKGPEAPFKRLVDFVPTFDSLHWQHDIHFDQDSIPRHLPKRTRFVRQLGPTELSYYLGTRGEGEESGVNDMYLHVGFKARPELMKPSRMLDIWTELTLRHPLLASSIDYRGPEDVYFVHHQPASMEEARNRAGSLMALIAEHDHKGGSIGPHVQTEPVNDGQALQEYHFMLFCTHFVGDGMALHATANQFFTLLAADSTSRDQYHFSDSIESVDTTQYLQRLPNAMESDIRAHQQETKLGWAAACADYAENQRQQIGGHTLPRQRVGPRETVVPTIAFDEVKTKQMLAACKAHGTTISNAVMSLVNLAYIRTKPNLDRTLSQMFYSAMSIRSHLQPKVPLDVNAHQDHFKIAISYYNIILPSFVPTTRSTSETFWSRCHVVKSQTTKAVKSPFVKSRTIITAQERAQRSIGFAREDERKKAVAKSVGLGLDMSSLDSSSLSPKPQQIHTEESAQVKAPSTALMGLSMLGNLDATYAHKTHNANGIELDSLTTGSRQRPGALLLFAYTFAGKLWLSLGYDVNGFKPGFVEEFWSQILKAADELIV
ncbi:hypothetical protein OIO90_001205 [Microbotryomycetes sp. JL221]|nr:hypothetical protein OIO90_001205 [Microbotryomycetes sp. JL221]